MKRAMIGTVLSTALVLGGMLNTATADTWVFRDTLRPGGHERGMAAKRADGRRCGASPGGRSFKDADAPNMRACMSERGWVLDHIIPDPPSAHARARSRARDAENDSPPPQIDNSINDDHARQRDQDNTQQMLNQQNFNNTQQMNNDQQFQQQQQQMINNMNNQ